MIESSGESVQPDPPAWRRLAAASGPALSAFVVRGGSMRPALEDGDVAILRRGAGRLLPGEIALCRRPSGPWGEEALLCHRVLWDGRRGGQGRILHRGDAGGAGLLSVPSEWEVVGRVAGIVRGDRIRPLAGWRALGGLVRSLLLWPFAASVRPAAVSPGSLRG